MNFLLVLQALFLTSLIPATHAEDQESANVEFLTRVVSDIASNGDQYVQFFRTGNQPINLGLLRTAQQITQSASGDSYTTLAADLAFMSDLSAMITPVPWYNERIATGNLSYAAVQTGSDAELASSTSTTTAVNEVNQIGVTYVGLGVVGGLVFAML
ncbi:hypothetical protein Cantr_01786 [Candida viswanathii]|uniref:Uncharacterized protein n=1 Tax=Candida viswanathii TaxID=5486 RepID=A0A367YLU4_9ASCO|nr:hypothetical protein Cantr_01786 [Candida viswanathii]